MESLKVIIPVIALAAAFIIILLVIFRVLFPKITKPADTEVSGPDETNTDSIKPAHLEIKNETLISEPSEASKVVSTEPETVQLPDISGLPIIYAKQILKDMGFEVKITAIKNETTPKNHVESTFPKCLEQVPKGSLIEIFISDGKPTVNKTV